MGALSFDALLRSLKQGVPDPVYYLHGDEDVLKDEAIRALLERAVEPAARDFNVDQRSAADLDAASFHALVNTPPMLAARRVVVIRGLEQLRKTAKVRQELLRYLDSPNPTTLLVLVQGAGEPPDAELAHAATAVAVDPLPPARVERWMAHRARQLGLTLAPGAGGGQPADHPRGRHRAGRRAQRGDCAGLGGRGARATRCGGGTAGRARAGAGGDERRAGRHGAGDRAAGDGAGARGARSRRAARAARVVAPRPSARRPPPRPGQLGAHRGKLGPLGQCLEPARAVARPAAGARRRRRAQIEHGDRRAGDSRAAGARVGRARTGGRVTVGRSDGRTVGRTVVLAAMLLSVCPTVRLSAQGDTLRAAALRVAQTRPDSARAMMRRLLASLSPQDSLYPGALFTAGRIAADATAAATNLQRVVVEYGRSVWADSALVLLTQLYSAQADPAATVQAAERLRRDYPDSPLRPRADFWAARAYFDLKDDARGKSLIRAALDGAGADVEFKNQVTFYASRCASTTAAPPVTAPATAGDTQAKPASPAATYAVQVLAVKSAAQVDEMLTRLKVMGFDARVVRDTSGLFKVRVGRYASHDEAAQAQRRLKTRLGGQPFVVEEP